MLIKHRLRRHIVIQIRSSARVLHHMGRRLGTLMVTVLCTTDCIVVLCVLLLLSVLDLFALGCDTEKWLITSVRGYFRLGRFSIASNLQAWALQIWPTWIGTRRVASSCWGAGARVILRNWLMRLIGDNLSEELVFENRFAIWVYSRTASVTTVSA